MAPLTRRDLIAAGLGAAAALSLTGAGNPAYAAPARPEIHPRTDWANGRSAKGQLAEEDVRFLIIHHSESPNTEKPGSIPGRLRGFYDYHTGTKAWPDVAYNFFVDPFGEIWEGRTGSLAGPVRGDATGGNQGFSQLCCFVGDHTAKLPTDAAMTAMAGLVAWLAGRYAIDLGAGKSIEFTSRGSNRWSKGVAVTTDPLVGHRDMSQTSCPGDALYPLVRTRILTEAQALMGARPASPSPTPSAIPSQAPDPTPTPTPAASTQTVTPVATAAPSPPATAAPEPGLADKLGPLAVPVAIGAGVLSVGAVVGGIIIAKKDS